MGFTAAEASEAMGNEEATGRSQLRTSRRRLATLLRLRCPEHPDGKNRHDADYWRTELLRRGGAQVLGGGPVQVLRADGDAVGLRGRQLLQRVCQVRPPRIGEVQRARQIGSSESTGSLTRARQLRAVAAPTPALHTAIGETVA
jgi:hypothetical protein